MNNMLKAALNRPFHEVRGEESRLLYWIREKVIYDLDNSEIEQKMKNHDESIEMINAVKEFSPSNLAEEKKEYVLSDEDAIREGRAEGEAAGYERANLEIARKMKAMGDSTERIHTITGLSPEAVENL